MPLHTDGASTCSLKGRLPRILALCLTLVFVLGALPKAEAVTKAEIAEMKKQQQQLNANKAALQEKLGVVQNDTAKAAEKKYLLEERISVLSQDIKLTDNMIRGYDTQIANKTIELEEAQAEEARYYDLFCERVRAMEKGGEVSYWAVLFNADDFSDLIDRINVIGEVMEYDEHMMDGLAIAREAVASAKADLEEARTGQVEAKRALEASKAELVQQERELNTLLEQMKAQAEQYKGQINAYAEDAADLSKDISGAEKQYAEQLRQQAAAAAAKNGTTTSSGGKVNLTGSGGFIWPLPSSTNITSKYGPRTHPISGRSSTHGGVDVGAAGGSTIIAAKGGTAVISAYNSSYGNYVVIAHPDGSKTLYAHMKSRACSAGDSINQGETIGYVGSTGSSTGNHLHFEVWLGSSSSSRTNPMNFF